MRLLITGAAGQLGQELMRQAEGRAGIETLGLTSQQLDITSASAINAAVEAFGPDVIINAAAYTAVDKAESEPERAHAVNVDGPRHLAEACTRNGARLIHVSTDFVFDGRASTPYAPDAPTNPLSVYGRTKRDGELAVMAALPDAFTIVRTAWVYGPGGRNFVTTMLRLLAERESLGVVSDQIGTPTSTPSLAGLLLHLARQAQGQAQILHWTDAGVASWYDFAVAIRELASRHQPDINWGRLRPISSGEYPTPARRPAFSILDSQAARALHRDPGHWREELAMQWSAIIA